MMKKSEGIKEGLEERVQGLKRFRLVQGGDGIRGGQVNGNVGKIR